MTITLVGLLLGGLVTERWETSSRLLREASHDRLTGLPNRALFSDSLSEALARSSESTFAVLVVDLDGFAGVNNALGHRMGDGLLVAVAERLYSFVGTHALTRPSSAKPSADALRDSERARTARIGGDAFAVLLEGVGSNSGAGDAARGLLDELARPYDLDGQELLASASAGVVLVEEAPEETDDLLRDADTALGVAKSKGPSSYAIFDVAMGRAARSRLSLGTDLRRAIDREEFVLHYQPIHSLETNAVVGAEALVRWEHPERGLLLPKEFIALAEHSGVIVSLGEWILGEACRWARGSHERYPSKSPMTISVNLSAKQLERPGFSDEIKTVLKQTGLDPRTLILEITETVLVDSADSIRETLDSLRRDGVRLAVDDFGTGYSSLSYLSRLSVDMVKIDRSFIRRLSGDGISEDGSAREISTENSKRSPADERLVSAIIDLAHGQDLTVIAEGVENAIQLECLKRTDCDMVQGYCFSEPLAGDKISALMDV